MMSDDNYISYQIGLLVAVLVGLVVMLIVIMPIKNLDVNENKCDEINKLMLDDTEHGRLHSEYPNILDDLHKYHGERCDMKMDSDKDE